MKRKKEPRVERHSSSISFGKSMGLTPIEMEMIRQKKKIAAKLRKAREAQGLSQSQLAEMISSHQPAIARMESGQLSEVSFDFLCRVALALEVSVTIRADAA